ncbi:MAG: hypothetical protein JO110_06730 [Acetobacteraceae bacterium]|nr:hypothetical protein [Acetobacteraceae bacterium]
MGLAPGRDGLIFVPGRYQADQPAALLVLLHGAASEAAAVLRHFEPLADMFAIIVLAPDSRGRSWDLILDECGADVAFISRALRQIFAGYAIDPGRVAIGGFSDGASCALSLGLANGELFHAILAFSPGFALFAHRQGRPRIFISHGVQDKVLPVWRCSRTLVPRLQRLGYQVLYREFDGKHIVPIEIIRESFEWLTGTVSARPPVPGPENRR